MSIPPRTWLLIFLHQLLWNSNLSTAAKYYILTNIQTLFALKFCSHFSHITIALEPFATLPNYFTRQSTTATSPKLCSMHFHLFGGLFAATPHIGPQWHLSSASDYNNQPWAAYQLSQKHPCLHCLSYDHSRYKPHSMLQCLHCTRIFHPTYQCKENLWHIQHPIVLAIPTFYDTRTPIGIFLRPSKQSITSAIPTINCSKIQNSVAL